MSRYGSGTLKQSLWEDIEYAQSMYGANRYEVIAALAGILADLSDMPEEISQREFKEKMKCLDEQADDNKETSHIKADELMCETLEGLGYEEGVKIFKEMPKYYI